MEDTLRLPFEINSLPALSIGGYRFYRGYEGSTGQSIARSAGSENFGLTCHKHLNKFKI